MRGEQVKEFEVWSIAWSHLSMYDIEGNLGVKERDVEQRVYTDGLAIVPI
jgi:hypothetical protein